MNLVECEAQYNPENRAMSVETEREGERENMKCMCVAWCVRERFIYYLKYRSHLPKRMVRGMSSELF